jgi:4-carboxymuconolactone decarboxylase
LTSRAPEEPDARFDRTVIFPEVKLADELFEKGMAARKAVLGADYVARAEANKTDFDADWQQYVTEHAWAAIWSRPGLDRRTRSMLTIAMLASLGRVDELAAHIRATRNTGVTQDEVKEVLLQVAVYAGAPAANSAFAVAKKTYKEMASDAKK